MEGLGSMAKQALTRRAGWLLLPWVSIGLKEPGRTHGTV